MSNNLGNTLLAFLAGAAIGAGMGILYAPESGERTRKKIKKSAKKAKEDLGERYEQLLQDVKEKAGNAKLGLSDRLEHVLSDASYKVEDVITTLEEKLEKLKSYNTKLQKEKATSK